ncbi:Ltp family lipoprotein [Butyrivibrio fibrisolvens]|uniref:Ltp family lipoprotein n=1 Tax=Butyrivibrio fibrisolvens TaxID=831 RepID=UPI0003FA72B7|nr:Ltp family lipoprotein [Butyrivibrio fibrisolvens]
MALIKCPNCNADISDKAERCPKCGFESVSKGISEPRIINKERIDNNKKDTIVITKRSLIIACLTLSFVFILIVVAGIVIYDQINRSRMVNEELNVSMMLEQEDYHYSTVADTNGDMEENGNIQNQSNFANDNASISATVTATEPSPSDKEEQDVGLGKKNALEKAQELLKYSSYSYEGLIDSLEYYEFTEEEAKYGADNCGENWN